MPEIDTGLRDRTGQTSSAEPDRAIFRWKYGRSPRGTALVRY
jgi:hypothetical protein